MSSIEEMIAEQVATEFRRQMASMPETVAELVADRSLVLTKVEAANLLRCSVSTIEKWMQRGLLPKMPHTSKVLIPRVALEEFVAGSATPRVTA